MGWIKISLSLNLGVADHVRVRRPHDRLRLPQGEDHHHGRRPGNQREVSSNPAS